ncbi:MAG: hypothetical protein ACLVKA_01540 [Collinsella aerofaciens]
MPGVKKYALPRLHEAIQLYVEDRPPPNVRVAMIDGINGAIEMQALIDFCAGTPATSISFSSTTFPTFPSFSHREVETLQRR